MVKKLAKEKEQLKREAKEAWNAKETRRHGEPDGYLLDDYQRDFYQKSWERRKREESSSDEESDEESDAQDEQYDATKFHQDQQGETQSKPQPVPDKPDLKVSHVDDWHVPSNPSMPMRREASPEACKAIESLLTWDKPKSPIRRVFDSVLSITRLKKPKRPTSKNQELILQVYTAIQDLAFDSEPVNPGVDKEVWEAALNRFGRVSKGE